MLKKFQDLSLEVRGWLSNYKLWHVLSRPIRNIKRIYRNYRLRHLCIGKVKQLDKTRYDKFEIVDISWDINWMMSCYLAVIIRDYLRSFIKNTSSVGFCVIKGHEEKHYNSTDNEFLKVSEELFQEWTTRVNSIADEFDELVKLNTGEGCEELTMPDWDKKMEELSRKAFADLAYIYKDLWW